MKSILHLIIVLGIFGCASQAPVVETSSQAIEKLNQHYEPRIGKATKSELVEEFGQAEWCEQKPGTAETCRFYKRLGTRWKGDSLNRTHYDAFDEMIADFDPKGFMRSFKANAQR